MRIALVGPAHPFKGGVAQHTTHLAHRLVAAGHDTQIVSWRRQYPRRLYPGLQVVEDPELPIFDPTRRVLSWDRPDTWLQTGRNLRAMDLVVFAHVTAFQVPAYWTIATTLRHRARTVVICHNVLPHERRPGDRFVIQQFFRSADSVGRPQPARGIHRSGPHDQTGPGGATRPVLPRRVRQIEPSTR